MIRLLLEGSLLGGPAWKLLLALGLLTLGAWLVRCGVDVCWSKAARRSAEKRPIRW